MEGIGVGISIFGKVPGIFKSGTVL